MQGARARAFFCVKCQLIFLKRDVIIAIEIGEGIKANESFSEMQYHS